MPAPTAPPPERTRRPLPHLALAAVLGLVVAGLGTPLLVASSFGGVSALLVALALLTGVAGVLATGIDRLTGPADVDPSGSLLRGLTVGVVGTGAAALFGVAVLQGDLRAELPDPVLCAAAALPFPVLAGLQWPGAFRRRTALVVVLGAVAGVAAWYPGTRQGWQDDRVLTEVGTLARPWVTEVDGFRGRSPQTTGSELIATPHLPADGGPAPELRLYRDALAGLGSEPCAAGTAPGSSTGEAVLSCRQVAPDRWSLTTPSAQVLLGREDDAWVWVSTAPGVPADLLDAALDAARPMTDDEYDAWLDEVLPDAVPSGY